MNPKPHNDVKPEPLSPDAVSALAQRLRDIGNKPTGLAALPERIAAFTAPKL